MSEEVSGTGEQPGKPANTFETVDAPLRLQASARQKELAFAASELDELYAAFPEFLDAAAFVLEDPAIGERIFAAVVPRPELSPSLDRLNDYLAQKRVARFTAADRPVLVRSIPRVSGGAVLRDHILARV